MKGVVFNILEDFTIEKFGVEFWEEILKQNDLDGVFVGPKTYPDSEFLSLVGSIVAFDKLDLADAIRAFGKFSYPRLAEKIGFLKTYMTPEEILIDLEDIIHVEVKKLLEDAETPSFDVSFKGGVIFLKYRSSRKFCFFLEGLLDGLADTFDMKLELKKISCLHKSDDSCSYELEFLSKSDRD